MNALLLVAALTPGADLHVFTAGAEVSPDVGMRKLTKKEINGVQYLFRTRHQQEFSFLYHFLEERATKKNILLWLDGIKNAKGIKEEDLLLFYFGFHGGNAPKGCSLWVHEGNGGLNTDEIRQRINKMPGHKIVLIDACHSGAAMKGDPWNATVITACGPKQAAWTDAMYFAIKDALDGKADTNGDHLIQLDEFVTYVPQRIKHYVTVKWKLGGAKPKVQQAPNYDPNLVLTRIP